MFGTGIINLISGTKAKQGTVIKGKCNLSQHVCYCVNCDVGFCSNKNFFVSTLLLKTEIKYTSQNLKSHTWAYFSL